MEGCANNLVSETPVLEDSKLAELKAILELQTKMILEALDESFAAHNARWDARCARFRGCTSSFFDVLDAAASAATGVEPNTAIDNISTDTPANCSTKCSGRAIDAEAPPVVYTVAKEPVPDHLRTVASSTAVDVVPGGFNDGAPSNCSTKCLRGFIDFVAPAAVYAVANELVLDPSLVAATSSANDVVPCSVNNSTPFRCSTKCSGGDVAVTVSVLVYAMTEALVADLAIGVGFSDKPDVTTYTRFGPATIRYIWPSFILSDDCSMNWDVRLIWKPPWPLQPGQITMCVLDAGLLKFLHCIMVISVSSVGYAAIFVLAGLISGADQLYIQSNSDVVVILLCRTQFLEHRMVLSIVKGAFMLKLLTVFGISSVDCLLLEHREMINPIVLQQLRFFEDKQQNGLALLLCYFQGRTRTASGFIIIWLADMHTEEGPHVTGSYNIQEMICIISYARFMEFNTDWPFAWDPGEGAFTNLYNVNLIHMPVETVRNYDENMGTSLLLVLDFGDWQPWPPSMQFKSTLDSSAIRPIPWPSFNINDNISAWWYFGLLRKPPWLLLVLVEILGTRQPYRQKIKHNKGVVVMVLSRQVQSQEQMVALSLSMLLQGILDQFWISSVALQAVNKHWLSFAWCNSPELYDVDGQLLHLCWHYIMKFYAPSSCYIPCARKLLVSASKFLTVHLLWEHLEQGKTDMKIQHVF